LALPGAAKPPGATDARPLPLCCGACGALPLTSGVARGGAPSGRVACRGGGAEIVAMGNPLLLLALGNPQRSVRVRGSRERTPRPAPAHKVSAASGNARHDVIGADYPNRLSMPVGHRRDISMRLGFSCGNPQPRAASRRRVTAVVDLSCWIWPGQRLLWWVRRSSRAGRVRRRGRVRQARRGEPHRRPRLQSPVRRRSR
jgi:hypothetical protein